MASKSVHAGGGCLMVVGGIFLAVGIVAAAVVSFADGANSLDTATRWIAALVFGGLGAGLVALGFWSARKRRETERLRRLHPDQPWMWRTDWAAGRARADAKLGALAAWGFAGVWNLVTVPVLFLIPGELEKGNQAVWAAALFPLVGVGAIIWAARTTLAYRKHGESVFLLDTLPGVVGGRLKGRVETGAADAPNGVRVALTCQHVWRRGETARTKLLWREERGFRFVELSRGYRGLVVPVDFRIPSDATPTSEEFRDRVEWKLVVSAEAPGLDYSAEFDVPVFRTAESDRAVEAEREPIFASERELEFDPARATFIERPSPIGGVEFYFPPRRNLKAAFSMAAFSAVWLGALAAMVLFDVWLLFSAVWALFALLLLWGVCELLFGVSAARVEDGRLRITHRTLGIGSTREIPCASIRDTRWKIGMTQNAQSAQAARAWYDVEVIDDAGKAWPVGRHIKEKREAEYFAERLRRAIGLRP